MIYVGNVDLIGIFEIIVGDGGIGVYFKEGIVKIFENFKINVGVILGKG